MAEDLTTGFSRMNAADDLPAAGVGGMGARRTTALPPSARYARAGVPGLALAGPLAPLLPLLAGMAVWAASLSPIDPASLDDMGLVSALPVLGWVALLLLSAGFCLVAGRPAAPGWQVFLYLAALVVVLHATPILAYGTLRYPWAWKHLGVVDYIERHRSVDPHIRFLAAYHNWPGFFAMAASVAELAGIRNLAGAARWAPLAFNLLYACVLPLIYARFAPDRRLAATATWIFIAGNWIGQDYFSPQAIAFLFYLLLLGLCLGVLARSPPAAAPVGRLARLRTGLARWLSHGVPPPPAPAGAGPRAVATVAAGLLIIAIVSSHQLTPLIMVLALAALVALQRLSPHLLIFAAAMLALWLSTVAMPFMSVMLPEEMQRLGTAVANVRTNLADTSVMSPGQATIARVARLLTTAIVLAAAAGGMRRLLDGVRDGPAVALAAAPLPLLVATSYGGEAIFRVYLFALPFLAFLAAALFYPSPARGASSRPTRIAAGLFGAALAVAFVFANNGKDRRYAFTRDEIAAAQWLYETAPPNTLLIEGASIYAAPPRNYENFVYVRLAEEPPGSRAEILSDPAGVLASWLEDDTYRDGYVILTRTQKAYVDSQGVMRRGALDDIERALRVSPRFQVVREGGGTTIFALRRARGDTSR